MVTTSEKLSQAYKEAWYKDLARYDEWNEKALYAIFAHLGKPKSYLDLGSGNGKMLRTAYDAGVKDSIGVEIDTDAQRFGHFGNIRVADLTQPLELGSVWPAQFDLVTCIEVGEHLPEAAADTLCETLARYTENWLVFTAAAPDQGGDGHINCQPQEYWRVKLQQFGLTYEETLTERLRETWKWVTGPMFWLPQNLQVFGASE